MSMASTAWIAEESEQKTELMPSGGRQQAGIMCSRPRGSISGPRPATDSEEWVGSPWWKSPRGGSSGRLQAERFHPRFAPGPAPLPAKFEPEQTSGWPQPRPASTPYPPRPADHFRGSIRQKHMEPILIQK